MSILLDINRRPNHSLVLRENYFITLVGDSTVYQVFPGKEPVTLGVGLQQVGPFTGSVPILISVNAATVLVSDQIFALGGGTEIDDNQAIITDGDAYTATGGQNVTVSVEHNEPTFTVSGGEPSASWQPFTVVAESDGYGLFGYSSSPGEEFGSISNEPLDGYTVLYCFVDDGGSFILSVLGPAPLGNSLWGADVEIDGVSFEYGPFNEDEAPYSAIYDDRVRVETVARVLTGNVPQWTASQQIPIVIIPKPM